VTTRERLRPKRARWLGRGFDAGIDDWMADSRARVHVCGLTMEHVNPNKKRRGSGGQPTSTRRQISRSAGVLGAMSLAPFAVAAESASTPPTAPARASRRGGFWPDHARLVISISMQFEAGAQPERGAQGPFPALDPHYPDLPMQTWYADFDVRYQEAATRRRMMSVSTHDRISGIPARVKAIGEFIDYAHKHRGVVFMRKDAIARFAVAQEDTPREGGI